jgi:neutral ceramidase
MPAVLAMLHGAAAFCESAGRGDRVMVLQAGFGQVDITPSLPCAKVGWLVHITADTLRDPLYARACVLDDGRHRLAIVSLDLLSIRWLEVDRIRDQAIALGLDPRRVMIAATHNHCGPAAVGAGDVRRDDAYIDRVLLPAVHAALRQAVESLQPATLMFGRTLESRVAFIRRFVMRDGSVRCHARNLPRIRCVESVLDPELAVLALAGEDGSMLGLLVNYACHPTHGGGDNTITAGWPGQMAGRLKEHFGPHGVPMLLNGAFGDVHHANPLDPDHIDSPQRVGCVLADDVQQLADAFKPVEAPGLEGLTHTLRLPWRDIDGPYGRDMPRRQRFGTDEIYEKRIERLREKQRRCDHFPAELQCLALSRDHVLVGIPGELFTELGLRIKAASPFADTHVVGAANGMVGYLPTRQAFDGGGYECTLITSSCLAPEAGDMVVAAALDMLRELHSRRP